MPLYVCVNPLRPSQHFFSHPVFLGLTSAKQIIKCLAQGHNAVPYSLLDVFSASL